MPPPGTDFSRWDPVAGLAQIAAYAGPGAVLQSYRLLAVKSDGTMDLVTEAYIANAEYEFSVPASSDPNKPVGAGGFVGPGHMDVTVNVFHPGQWRHVTSGNSEYDYKHQGMEKRLGSAEAGGVEAKALPACTPVMLWKTAMEKGAPPSAVATIRWDDGEYDFDISGANVSLEFDPSCRLKR